MICVRTYLTRPTAEGARLALEAEGIEVLILADDAGGVRPELSMQKGVRVMVPEQHAEEAIKILDECESKEIEGNRSDSAENAGGFLTRLRKWLQG